MCRREYKFLFMIKINWWAGRLKETLFSKLARWTLEYKGVGAGHEVLICVSPDTGAGEV